ncbi:MAG TPA: efflux RND transporter permease subunit [Chloroflexota bacterium]
MITEFSLRNPLVVWGITVGLCLFGLFAYFTLGVAVTPNVNIAAVVVTTAYPGADPETVETNITKPIEDAIAVLPNIDTNGLTSVSTFNVSIVTVQFSNAANPDQVSVDVQRVVNGVRGRLPADAEVPTVNKVDFNALAIAKIILSGPQPLTQLQTLSEDFIQPQLNSVPGVGSSIIRSGVTREIHVKVDEEQLRGRGLSINQVVGAVQSQQIEVPAGSITQGRQDFSVFFDALAPRLEALGDIVVSQSPSGPVLLRHVARLEDTQKQRDGLIRIDGREGISLVVMKLPDANTIAVSAALKRKLEELRPQLPGGARLDVVIDGANYTEGSFNTVRNALLEAVLVTGMILLLFLHTWRSTLIVLVSIPVSLLSTLALMVLLKYNLNLLTMVALTVSVGILVDDSIVVLENIARHLERGKSAFQAAVDGRSEIGLAAVTITLVDVVVYVPVALMTTGLPSQFLVPFAVVITVATLSSLVVSFTLTPMMARVFLRHGLESVGRSPLDRFGRAWDRGFEFLERRYATLLRVSLPRRWLVIAIGFGSFAAGIALMVYGLIGLDFFPSGDQGEIDITLTMPAGTSLDATDAAAQEVERVLRDYPEVRNVFTAAGQAVGSGGPNSVLPSNNLAQVAALLVGRHERHRTSSALAEDMRRQLETRIPGGKIRIGLPNAFGVGGFGGAPVQVQIQGPDPATVDQLARHIEQAVHAVPGAVGIDNTNDNVQTQLRARFDSSRAADLGVNARDAGTAVRAAIDGVTSNASRYRPSGKSAIPIRVLTESGSQMTLDQLARLPIASPRGVVNLGQVVTLEQARIPTTIQHVNRLRSVTIAINAGEGRLVGDLQSAVQRAVRGVALPSAYAVTYAGAGQIGGSAFGDLARALAVAVVLMYMLMMMLFGSLVLPLAVLVSLPLALIGALGAMALARSPFTLFAMLGVAVLVGLVGKNAILLVDRTVQLRREGYDRTHALLTAGPTRLRPIVMTTISVMAALIPIATGVEEGSELLVSVALVLIGGLLTSTLLTLVFVPAMYTVFDDLQQLATRPFQPRRRTAPVEPPPAPAPIGRAVSMVSTSKGEPVA